MWALLLAAAFADPVVTVDARVGDDLRVITGTVTVDADGPFTVVDPLSRWPEPPDDRNLFRTYPGAPDRGSVAFAPAGEGVFTFRTTLPRRYGDVGAIGRFGLFANGAWYPQVLVDGEVPVASWTVDVVLPDDTVGAVGDAWGHDALRWEGRGERASLAVLPGGVATRVVEDGVDVTLLTRRRPRRALTRALATQLDLARPPGTPLSGVVVEAPLRRRLSRGGVGLAYVSDRAWRVSPGLHRFHHVSATRGVLAGLLPLADPFLRDVTAAALSRRHAGRLAGAGARGTLRFAAWLPGVDALLYDRTLPFVSDILEDVHPGDPVRDDLLEVWDPHVPGPAVVAQLDDTFGEGTSGAVAVAVLSGAPPPLPPGWLDRWRVPYPDQDYTLAVADGTARIARDAPPDAPPETLTVRVGEATEAVVVPPGGAVTLPVPEDARVVLDPSRHVRQRSRIHDAWPAPLTVTAAGWIDTVSLTPAFVEAAGTLRLRRRYDTRNAWSGSLSTTRENLVSATLGYTRREGRLLDGLRRPHAFTAWVNPAVLNQRYARIDGDVALGAGLSWRWDDRVALSFPLRGRGIGASVDGGFVPGTGQRWGAVRSSGVVVGSPHPRHAVAARASVGLAGGDVPHRLLALGGPSGLRSLPYGAAIGTRRALAVAEYRFAPIRNASVPLLLGWGSELQLTAGVEAGTSYVDGDAVYATGVTAGIAGRADVLGALPRMLGVTLAWPVWTHGVTLERTAPAGFDPDLWPEAYLRWSQAF